MFARIKVLDERETYYVDINVTNIVDVSLVNPRNVNSGTLIYLIDGRFWESPDTRDLVMRQINDTVERFGNQILVTYIGSELKKNPVKRTRKSPQKK